jgi:uncharacterized protein YukE
MRLLNAHFYYDAGKTLTISELCMNDNYSYNFVNRAIELRERAIEALLNERREVREKINDLQRQLTEIESQIARLGGLKESKFARGARRSFMPASHRSTKSGLVDKRYKSLWPLPGGRRRYASRLKEILSRISKTAPSLEELTDWGMNEYTVADWVGQAIKDCVIYTGFAESGGSKVRLTKEGEHFLATGDQIIISKCLEENIWGIREMIEWLEGGSMTLEGLYQKFNELGSGWRGKAQVKYRLYWMIVAGQVHEEKGHWPTLYALRRR